MILKWVKEMELIQRVKRKWMKRDEEGNPIASGRLS